MQSAHHSKTPLNIGSFSLLLILGSLMTVNPFSVDLYLPAFAQIAADLRVDVPTVSLTLSSYFIGMAIGQIAYGPFLDRFGRKPPLIVGLLLYIVATACCAYASSVESLIAFRLLQAVGGCSAQVAALAMVRDFYSPEEGAKVFSRMMLILSVSPMLAPTLGGLIASAWGWRTLFIALCIVVVLILINMAARLPESHNADAGISLNPIAILKEFAQILRTPPFFVYCIAGAWSFSGLFSYLAGASALFMGKYGLSENQFGLIFAGLSVGMIGGGQFNILLSRWFSSAQIFKYAIFFQVIMGSVFLVSSTFFTVNLAVHIGLLFFYISCIGLTYPNAAALALAPFERNVGSAASLLGFLQTAIGAFSSMMFGLLSFPTDLSMGIIFMSVGLLAFLFLNLGRRWLLARP